MLLVWQLWINWKHEMRLEWQWMKFSAEILVVNLRLIEVERGKLCQIKSDQDDQVGLNGVEMNWIRCVNVNVTDTILWQGHHDRVIQLNWLYFCGICQMINIVFYFENVAFFHTKLRSDVCPRVDNQFEPNLWWWHFTRYLTRPLVEKSPSASYPPTGFGASFWWQDALSHQLVRIREETLESVNLFSDSWISASVPISDGDRLSRIESGWDESSRIDADWVRLSRIGVDSVTFTPTSSFWCFR